MFGEWSMKTFLEDAVGHLEFQIETLRSLLLSRVILPLVEQEAKPLSASKRGRGLRGDGPLAIWTESYGAVQIKARIASPAVREELLNLESSRVK